MMLASKPLHFCRFPQSLGIYLVPQPGLEKLACMPVSTELSISLLSLARLSETLSVCPNSSLPQAKCHSRLKQHYPQCQAPLQGLVRA